MSYGRSMDYLRGAVEKHLATGNIKREICAAARAELKKLPKAFDPWDGPIDYAIASVYDELAKKRQAGMRWLEVAHNTEGDRVDRRPEQLTLFEGHAALDRRVAQHEADGVWIARWHRVLTAADKEAARRGADPRTATLGELIGAERVTEYLRGEEAA